MVQIIAGLKGGNAIVPYEGVSKQTKWVDISGDVTAGNHCTSIDSVIFIDAQYKEDSAGFKTVDIRGHITATIETGNYLYLNLANISILQTSIPRFIGAARVQDAAYTVSPGHLATAFYSAGDVLQIDWRDSVTGASGITVKFSVYGIELDAEPSWVAANLETRSADQYMLPATFTEPGLFSYPDVAPTKDITVPSGKVLNHPFLTVSSGRTVTINAGAKLFSADVEVIGDLEIIGDAIIL